MSAFSGLRILMGFAALYPSYDAAGRSCLEEPQMRITFQIFTRDDLAEFRAWFDDAELSRRLSFPTDQWFAYVTAGDSARCWAALDSS